MGASDLAISVRNSVSRFYSDGDELVGIIEFLEEGNSGYVLDWLKSDRELADYLNLLRKALWGRMLLSLTRMYDHWSEIKPSDRRTLSRVFHHLTSDLTLRDGLGVRGNKVYLDMAIAQWKTMNNADIRKKLKNHRDKQLAHNLDWNENDQKAANSELMNIAEQTMELVGLLAAGTGVNSVGYNAARQIWNPKAKAYWQRLCLSRNIET